jgi:hypothetical protein
VTAQNIADRLIGDTISQVGERPDSPVIAPAPVLLPHLHNQFRDSLSIRGVELPGDKRKLMDFRRSGAVEATAGKVDPTALASKMANTIDQSKELQAAYLPVHSQNLIHLRIRSFGE